MLNTSQIGLINMGLSIFFLPTADDGLLLLGLPKIKVLRNDQREGKFNLTRPVNICKVVEPKIILILLSD